MSRFHWTQLHSPLPSLPVSSLTVHLTHINLFSVLFLWQSSVSWFWLFWVLEADWRWWWWSRCLLWSWHCMISWDADRRSNISCLSHSPGPRGAFRLLLSQNTIRQQAGLDLELQRNNNQTDSNQHLFPLPHHPTFSQNSEPYLESFWKISQCLAFALLIWICESVFWISYKPII